MIDCIRPPLSFMPGWTLSEQNPLQTCLKKTRLKGISDLETIARGVVSFQKQKEGGGAKKVNIFKAMKLSGINWTAENLRHLIIGYGIAHPEYVKNISLETVASTFGLANDRLVGSRSSRAPEDTPRRFFLGTAYELTGRGRPSRNSF